MKNWKNDDELLNLAFGELSDRDSQAFEAWLMGDSSAQKELDLLRTLRSDLTAIRDDIPEMQFSKERLRDAILASGKPARPAFPWLNWVLGPAALASVAALAFVMTKGSGSKETVFVASNTKPALEKVLPKTEIKAPAVLTEERVASVTVPPINLGIAETAPSIRTTVRKAKPAKKRGRTQINSGGLVASLDRGQGVRMISDPPRPLKPNSDSVSLTTFPVPPATTNTVPSTEAAPIILIDANTDSGVGAPTATEVSNPTNVAIGG